LGDKAGLVMMVLEGAEVTVEDAEIDKTGISFWSKKGCPTFQLPALRTLVWRPLRPLRALREIRFVVPAPKSWFRLDCGQPHDSQN